MAASRLIGGSSSSASSSLVLLRRSRFWRSFGLLLRSSVLARPSSSSPSPHKKASAASATLLPNWSIMSPSTSESGHAEYIFLSPPSFRSRLRLCRRCFVVSSLPEAALAGFAPCASPMASSVEGNGVASDDAGGNINGDWSGADLAGLRREGDTLPLTS
eukprot:CAMPEP_0178670596 /NCGR_PEP_ID=MMETSP0698-20121128/32734_1 /TAXON_ID=265572 /ORGANISM="Extubocellulus spinifer, Strain CCMP396" /LENGTH=159 /DNA_ID=CAMNT_0020314313 /DNA_START=79 /DNA_END=555 /DNA_ORIENTATION=+